MAFRDTSSPFPSSSGAKDHTGDPSQILGRFVPPPPQFMFSAAEEATYIQFQNPQNKVWLLNVSLPLQILMGGSAKERPFATRAVVYEAEAYSFLLFLDIVDNVDASCDLLQIESRLKDMVLASNEKDRDIDSLGNDESERIQWTEPGQDVVIVDRGHNKLYLFSDRKQATRKDRKKQSAGKNPPKRFLTFGTKSQTSSGDNDRSRSTHLEWAALGLDCRHLLASHLHLDILLAFDDMMNEIALRKRSRRKDSDITSHAIQRKCGVIELCTCMPLGWIYACGAEEMELYAFFDSSIYVTVADVQSAATKIQEYFFGQRRPKS